MPRGGWVGGKPSLPGAACSALGGSGGAPRVVLLGRGSSFPLPPRKARDTHTSRGSQLRAPAREADPQSGFARADPCLPSSAGPVSRLCSDGPPSRGSSGGPVCGEQLAAGRARQARRRAGRWDSSTYTQGHKIGRKKKNCVRLMTALQVLQVRHGQLRDPNQQKG